AEVQAVEDLLACLGVLTRVQGVDLGAVAAGGQGVGEGGAQVPERDVETSAQVGHAEEGGKAVGDLSAGGGVGEGAGVVRGVAARGERAGAAGLPVPFVGEDGDHAVHDRSGAVGVGQDVPGVEVDD